jgi:drug/metabolite transporter (DMT)-like permease
MPSAPPFRLSPLRRGRLCIVAAALLWSLSGGFSKALTRDTILGLQLPPLTALQIAFYRGLFAGLCLLPGLRRQDATFRPLMIPMVAVFAVMSATFVTAQVDGTAANAIFLQYTAPTWMFLASVFLLGERVQRRSLGPVLVGLVGVGVIVAGGWGGEDLPVIGLGLASGVCYAGIVIFLRVLRDASSRWLAVLNLIGSALALSPWVVHLPLPSGPQLAVLLIYGGLQMGLPYWLMGSGLRTVSPQEAGTISLLEPLLNPVWAYLVVGERPADATLVGGAFILGALVWRYWPGRGAAREGFEEKPDPGFPGESPGSAS